MKLDVIIRHFLQWLQVKRDVTIKLHKIQIVNIRFCFFQSASLEPQMYIFLISPYLFSFHGNVTQNATTTIQQTQQKYIPWQEEQE